MQIENNKGVFNLIDNTPLSIEKTNPFTSEQGSASLPYKFIRTRHNQNLLENVGSEESYKTDVNIRSGVFNINASLDILSISEKTIEGVFLLDETSFYQVTKNTNLPEAFQDKKIVHSNMDAFIAFAKELIFKDLTSDEICHPKYSIFPIVKDAEINARTYFRNITAYAPPQNLINEVYNDQYLRYSLRAESEYTYKDENDNEIKVPKGYGLTLFLRLSYILESVFEYLNLSLDMSAIDWLTNFHHIVVVNNTQDAGLYDNGTLDESQLVPDCTISEFLDCVRKLFCAEFVIDTNKNTAKLVLLKDVIKSTPQIDLNQYMQARPSFEIHQPTKISLSVKKEMPNAGTDTDTFEQFKERYSELFKSAILPSDETGIYMYPQGNTLMKYSDRQTIPGRMSDYKTDFVSSMNFDFSQTLDIDTEEHKIPFNVPVTVTTHQDNFKERYNEYYSVYVGNFRNLNSHVILDGASLNADNASLPIIFALEAPGREHRIGTPNYGKYPDGRIYPNDILPGTSLHTWSEQGIYNNFYKEYDYCLQNSWHTVKCKLRLPADMIQNFKFDNLYLINGQPVLPVSLKYEMKEERHIIADCEFRTVEKVNPWLSF